MFGRIWLEDKVEPLARMIAAQKMGLKKIYMAKTCHTNFGPNVFLLLV